MQDLIDLYRISKAVTKAHKNKLRIILAIREDISEKNREEKNAPTRLCIDLQKFEGEGQWNTLSSCPDKKGRRTISC